ncbi:hypothetical protein [Corynebacterium sp. p3-SID1194]|uniref:hypothetical protein n=1 Tax=Corynebacterium sp. p3-SID1194 TaxID=2916105 RepID=UPI0021A3B1A7|nr:hypothetical protein [Corynebacterium sp. p3-SID1194]MCT1451190.1 hypothetical protein [Corynebacterium sp. p3-SID1194]
MKNFTRRRGTAVAAAALSLALVAPFTNSVAGAEDAQETPSATSQTNEVAGATKIQPGKTLTYKNKALEAVPQGVKITVTFPTSKGKEEVEVDLSDENGEKVVKVRVPENAQSGTVEVKAADQKVEIPVTVEAKTSTPESSATETTTPESSTSETTTPESSTPSSSAPSSTPKAGTGSSITDNDKCRTAVLGWGIPLAVLVPVGLLANAAVPGLRALRHAAGDFVREANAQFQNQIGVMNPELAALQANFNDQLRQFNTDITQLAFGAAFLGLGVGALAHLGTACSPAATVIPTKATTTKTEKPETPTQKPTQENSTPKTTEPAAEVTTSSSSAAEPTTSETTEEPTKEPEAESQQ